MRRGRGAGARAQMRGVVGPPPSSLSLRFTHVPTFTRAADRGGRRSRSQSPGRRVARRGDRTKRHYFRGTLL
ncbi:unnamed protein product, partial [Brenthis ino]